MKSNLTPIKDAHMMPDKQFPVMENMTVKSVREYLHVNKSIIIPVGVTEQHGYHLVLTELEAELGIGRGPIREALMRLDKSGLVKNIPFKGAVVANPPSRREIAIDRKSVV